MGRQGRPSSLNAIDRYHPDPSAVGFHVGIIPDGGRRWARRERCLLEHSYNTAGKAVARLVAHLFSKGASTVSVYFSSAQNFRRPAAEIEAFCNAQASFCDSYFLDVETKYATAIRPVGRIDSLPTRLSEALATAKARTSANSATTLNLCVAYSPLDEILDSVRSTTDPSEVLRHLWVKTPLALVIRTGGARLLSNFLPLQVGFARLYFLDELFNDVTLSLIDTVLADYESVTKAYGT